MNSSLSPLSRRTSLSHCQHIQCGLQQVRHATLIKRPKRPYTFTQLVTLSDGSTYLQRTTSPIPVYKATKDMRNSPLWNPSSSKLHNVEDDEAGRLAGFRARYGRAWDSETAADKTDTSTTEVGDKGKADVQVGDSLLDMIGSYQNRSSGVAEAKAVNKDAATSVQDKAPKTKKG